MKNIKQIYFAALLLLPVNVFAAGNMVGTGVIADGIGLVNVYYQHKLSEGSAATIGYASVDGKFLDATVKLTSLSASYKGYFSQYANGGYWQVGASSIDLTVSSGSVSGGITSGTLPVLLLGYESTFGKSFVLGVEGGFGTNQGLGIFGVNAAYMF